MYLSMKLRGQVLVKPYIPDTDSNGRPEAEVSTRVIMPVGSFVFICAL